MGAHALIAMKAGGHWNMPEPEAKVFAVAIGNVLRHYPMRATQKVIDHMALVGTVALGYTPRIHYSRQLAAQRAAAAARRPGPAQVYPFNMEGNGTAPMQAPVPPPGVA